MGRETRESVKELRAIAPLIVTGPSPQLVGPCTLVTNGTQTIAFSSAELLRQAGEPLAIALSLDGKHTVPVTAWSLSRCPRMGIIDLGTSVPRDPTLDVEPLPIGSVYATVDTKGAPSALVTVHRTDTGIARRVIPVHVDAIDGGAISDDVLARLASPDESADVDAPVEGAALVSWMPADPVLGRPSEVVIAAVACTYRQRTFKPRALPALAELFGLEDLGRALPWNESGKEGSNELGQVAGEIKDEHTDPLAGLEIDIDS